MYIRLSLFVWSIFVLTALVSLLIAARPSVAAETGDERIIGSSKAAIGDIQGFVVIKSVTPKGEIKCGGMLIDPQWVATTTACVEGYASIGGKPNITVAVGCQTNEPYICVDKNNTSVLFHQRRRELVGATRVVQYATAKLALIQIPRVVLGSGVGVFPVAAAGDLAAMSGAPSVLGMGDIANVSDVNKAKAPAVMKATVALTTDSACQTTYGSGYSSGLNGCLERTGAMLFCRDTGSPVIGNVAGQPIALGIMLSEKTLGTNESARCTATMRKMGYIDLTVPATRNWIRDTVRAGVKRPVVTRLDGLYGENATLTNDRAKDIDISAVFPTGIRIGATTSSVLSVSENGLVALGSGVNVSSKGFDLSRWRGAPLIVPFFADANTSGITLKAAIGDAGMDGRNAVWTAVDPLKRTVTITWEAIRPAWGVTALTLPQNTFQLVMQNMNNGDVKIVLNYGLLSWNIGEKNCADPCNYITAKRAQIGLSAGNGPVLLHPASGKVNQLDLIAAKGTAYSVIRAGKFGGWDANPAPVSTWTATMTPTASVTWTASVTASHLPSSTNTATPTATITVTPSLTPTVGGLLAWYPLNGISTTGSTVPSYAETVLGPAQSFDGVDDVHRLSLNLANRSFTVAVWAALGNRIGNPAYNFIVSAGNTNKPDEVFGLGYHTGNEITCSFYADDLNVPMPATFDFTEWHHYACTYDNATRSRKLFVDGKLVGADIANSPLKVTADFYIGYHSMWTYGLGTFRDIQVYDQALTMSVMNRVQSIAPSHVMLNTPHPANGCRWVDKGGNVHEYEVNHDVLSWDQAKIVAEQRMRGGQAGYLATVTSAAESNCLNQLLDVQRGWANGSSGLGPWLGAKRTTAGGPFVWQGGPEQNMLLRSSTIQPFTGYDNWHSSEPNNQGGNENALVLWDSTNRTWNDGQSYIAYKSLIEYTYPDTHEVRGEVYTDSNSNTVADPVELRASNQVVTLTADLPLPIDIIGGGNQQCARLTDGRATCWGRRGTSWRWDQQSAVPIEVDGWRDVQALSNGMLTSCALLGTGAVSCVGQNSTGAIGDGTTTDRWTPVPIELRNASVLNSGGAYHHCAVMRDTSVKCWGDNTYGQLGDGTYVRRVTPVAVVGLSGVAEVSVGERHTCARTISGAVWCWGSNDAGQLASTAIAESVIPRQIIGLTGATALAAGWQHTCAREADTQVLCWGHSAGITGDRGGASVTAPTLIDNTLNSLSLSVGNEQSCIAKYDGSVWCWGHVFHGEAGWTASGTTTVRRGSATQMSGLSAIAQVALSRGSGCGRRVNGDVLCWGEASMGQLGDGTYVSRGIPREIRITWQTNPAAARIAMIDGNNQLMCGILSDRRVTCWGVEGFYRPSKYYTKTEPETIPGLADVVDLQVNTNFACALQRMGTLWCWGFDLPTQVMEPGTLSGSAVEKEAPRRLTTVKDAIALAKGRGVNCLAVTAAGEAYCYSDWWTDLYKLVPNTAVTNVAMLGPSYIHNCALKHDGKVSCWGDNSYFAQFGNGIANTTTNIPTVVSSLSNVQQLVMSSFHSCVLLASAEVKCWGKAVDLGSDGAGQQTASQGSAYATPIPIPGLGAVKKVFASESKNCAVLQNGTVWCWGSVLYDGERTSSITPYQVTGISDAVDIAIASEHPTSGVLCVLQRGGSVRCLGAGAAGGLGNGQTTNRVIARPISEPWQARVLRGCEWVDWQGQRHWYEVVPGEMTWSQAVDAVAHRTSNGVSGYLATITSPEENRCLHQLFVTSEDLVQWPGMRNGWYPRVWLGGSDAESEGTWKWINGPEAGSVFRTPTGLSPAYHSFQSQSDGCKPDCSARPDWDYLQMMFPYGTATQAHSWNDETAADAHTGMLVEYTSGPGERARQYTTKTDNDGVYSFVGLQPGSYTVETQVGGVTRRSRITIWPENGTIRSDIRLP